MNEADRRVVAELRLQHNMPENLPRGFWRKPENRAILEALKEYDIHIIAAALGLSLRGTSETYQTLGISRPKKATERFGDEDIATVEKLAAALNGAKLGETNGIWISHLSEINERRKAKGLPVATKKAVSCFVGVLNVQRAQEGKPPLKLGRIKRPKAEGGEEDRVSSALYPKDRLEALLGLPDLPSHTELQKEPPKTSAEKPYRIQVKDPRHAKLAVINSPAIGTITDPADNKRFLMRNALRLAGAKGADAVLVTGNLVYIDHLRYSNLRPFRAKLSAIKAKEGITHHPESVEEDSGTVSERLRQGRVAFVTFKQRFDYVLSLVKDLVLEDGKPVFSGPILLSFGSIEEALAMWYASEKISIDVLGQRRYASDRIRDLKADLKAAHAAMRKGEPSDIDVGETERELKDFLIYRDLFVKMTNAIDAYTNVISAAMRNYMVQQIESSIPNAKVISVGDTYFEVPHKVRGPKLIQVAHEKTTDSVTGEFGGRLRETMRERTKRDRRPPDVVLGGGLNPKFEYLQVPYRTREGAQEYEDMKLVRIIQLPTLLDSDEFRQVSASFVQTKDRLTRLASREEFTAGMAFLEFIDGFTRVSAFDDRYLTNPDIFNGEPSGKAAERLAASVAADNMLYCLLDGDNHSGARFSAYYEVRKPRNGRHMLFHDQIVFEFLLEHDAPIVSMSNTGDTLHWQNYPTGAEIHPDYLPEDKLVLELRRIDRDAALAPADKERRKEVLLQKNTIFAGLLTPEEQLDAYMRRLRPQGIKFMSQMLRRAEEIGFQTFGDIGIITYVHGNHNEYTFSKSQGPLLTESGLIRAILVRDLAIYRPDLFGKLGKKYLNPAIESSLDRMIQSPRFGTLGAGSGLFGVVGDSKMRAMRREEARMQTKFYLYGIYIRHKQATSKKKSNVKAMQRSFAERGSVEADFVGRFVVNQAGDDHYGGFIIERDTLHIKNGGQLFRGDYGERKDFGVANILSMVWAVPKDGPHTGPIVVIPLSYEDLRPWANQRHPVNGKALFANAVAPKVKQEEPEPSSQGS